MPLSSQLPAPVPAMLAVPGDPPSGPSWAFEFKWDGVRACAVAALGHVELTSRNNRTLTRSYPELEALATLVGDHVMVLDGEIVALDQHGRPRFSELQRRMHTQPGPDLLAQVPVTFYAFDVLHLDGTSLLDQPQRRRRELLDHLDLDDRSPRVRVPPCYPDAEPDELLRVAGQHGLEGIVAKRQASHYHPGKRSKDWIKTALLHTQEVIVGGWQPGEGRRAGTIGALLLGAHDEHGQLRYLGQVGTGFTDHMLRDLHAQLTALALPDSPFDEPVPREHARYANWVRPHLVGEVVYRTATPEGRLRHASWRGLRPDKAPAEVLFL